MHTNKLSKKVLSLLLTLAMLCGLMVTTAFAAYSPTTITTTEQLAAMSLSGDYVLGANLTIDASTWTPVGTAAAPFTGTFDGKGGDYTITWTGTGAGSSYYGIFGSSSGVVANVNAAGALTLTGSGSYVSPVVGYSSGSVYDCHSSVTFSAASMDNVGGIVGAMENLSAASAPIYTQYCTVTGDITASKRVGGVVGAVYCNVQGNCVVDQCAFKNAQIYTTNSSKVWSGGVSGYTKGVVSNCYTDNITLKASGGHYLSGLVGILNGSNPSASAVNCYANVTGYTNCAVDYERPFVGSVDNSSAVTLTNCYWTETNASYTQPTTGGWGTWTNSGIINSAWSNLSLGDKFTTGSHPSLKCEAAPYIFDIETGAPGGATGSTVHLGGTTTGAYTDLAAALDAVGSGGTIIVDGATDITTALSRFDDVTIQRGDATGALFNVNAGAGNIVNLTTMTIDGGGSGTLFSVESGTLRLRGNITLKNCATAVDVLAGGALTVNKADISAASHSVKVAGSTSTFTLEDFGGTSISGAVYLGDGAVIGAAAAIPADSANPLVVECQSPEDGLTIVSGSGYTLTLADAGSVSYTDSALFAVEWSSSNNLILVEQ